MKTLQKIIAGIALTSALTFGYKANAQEQNVLVPTKVSTETSAINNKDVSGVPFQRVEAGNDAWSFKYDINMKLKPSDCPVNVGMLSLNKLYSNKNTSIGAEIFQVGKFNEKDIWFVDAFIAKKMGDISLMLDYGKGLQKDRQSKDYVIATLKHPKFSLEGCAYPQGSVLEKNVKTLWCGFGSYKGDNVYASLGNKVQTGYASAGLYGFKDFGQLLFGMKTRDNGDIWIKSQTALGDVNQAFFSKEMFEIASEYFAMPAYFPMHFSPISTRGNIALKLEYKKNSGVPQTEIMLATDKTPVQIGLGVNTSYQNNSSISNVAIELYKDFKLGKKFTGSIEGRYNNRTKETTGYLKMKYNI